MKIISKVTLLFTFALVFFIALDYEKASAASNPLPWNTWQTKVIKSVQGETYNLHLVDSSLVTLEMTNNEQAKWDMVITNKDNKELLNITSTTYLFDGKATKREVGLPKGDYIVQVKGNSGNFESIASLFRVNVQIRSDYEKEDNTLLQSANTISLNKTYYGNIHNSNDSDSFKFSLAADSKTTLNLSNKKDVIWEAIIYDKDEREYLRLKSTNSSSGNVTSEVGLAKGTYYVVIRQQNSHKYDNERYNFNVSTNSNPYVEQENNDSMNVATKIQLGKRYEGMISNSSDIDYFRVDVPTNNIYTSFAISNKKGTQWQVSIYNESGGVLKNSFISKSTSSGDSTFNTYLPKGTYYMLVTDSKNSINQKYSIKVITKTKSSALKTKNISVKNVKGAKDTVTVKSVSKKDIIRIYSSKGKLLKTATATGSTITISKLNLGKYAGQIQVSIQQSSKLESSKIKVKFSKEK